MSYKRGNKSAAFLVEMIIVILFFAIASAITLKLFVSAHLQSRLSTETDRAVVLAQTAAEGMSSSGSIGGALSYLSAKAEEKNDSGCTVYFDENWQPSDKAEGSFEMSISASDEDTSSGKLVSWSILITKLEGNTEIYTLDGEKYIPA